MIGFTAIARTLMGVNRIATLDEGISSANFARNGLLAITCAKNNNIKLVFDISVLKDVVGVLK